MKALLDTNAYIAWSKGDQSLAEVLLEYSVLSVSWVTIGELYFGAEKSARVEANKLRLAESLTEFETVLPDVSTPHFYGRICFSLKQRGRPIPQNDIWISAVAVQFELALISRDSHFSSIEDLTVRQW